MNFFTKLGITLHILKWTLTWSRHDCNYPVPAKVKSNPKFMTARQAVDLIHDNAVLGLSGIVGNARSCLLYWAIREKFLAEGYPKNLTTIGTGGQGGSGKSPGTIEEIAIEGLHKRMFVGHVGTNKAQAKMAAEGKLEIQIIPQGTLDLILKAQTEGRNYVINETGRGTFVDPRTGRGTPLTPGSPQWVEVLEDGRFKYSLPNIEIAIFNAPAADRKGNIYMKNAAVLCESYEIAKAAKRNGGKVIVNVGLIVDEGYDKVFLPAEEVDAIVYWPGTEQTASLPHSKYWDLFTTESKTPLDEGIARINLINKIAKIAPLRTPVEEVTARLAAKIFTDNARKHDHVDVGVGLPEEISRILYNGGAIKDLVMINESGVFGGIAAPGIYFGAAVNPTEIISSAAAFERIYSRLDWVLLGTLEVDSRGNVNVSSRGGSIANYVGPGGFIDLITCSKSILFCTAWGEKSKVELQDGKVKIIDPGKRRFKDKVTEITFNGAEALKHGKKVYYVTYVGAFELTPKGMELIYVMPGIDIQKDIIDGCEMKVVIPEGGPKVCGPEITTGQGFKVQLKD